MVFGALKERWRQTSSALLFRQAVCLAFIPVAAHSAVWVTGQGMQKKLEMLLVTTVPYTGSLLVLSRKEDWRDHSGGQREYWEVRNPNVTQTRLS